MVSVASSVYSAGRDQLRRRCADEEALMDVALEAGAEDIEGDEDGAITVTAPWETLDRVGG